MSIIYSDTEKHGKFVGDYYSMPANSCWLKHYGNYLILSAILKDPNDAVEKRQAQKELATCERKLDYWKKHPNFNTVAAANDAQAMKKLWKDRLT